MLAQGYLFTNSTDASLRMCTGEFGQKCLKLVVITQGINARPRTSKPKVQSGSFGSLTQGDSAHARDMSLIQGETFPTNQARVHGSMGPPELEINMCKCPLTKN